MKILEHAPLHPHTKKISGKWSVKLYFAVELFCLYNEIFHINLNKNLTKTFLASQPCSTWYLTGGEGGLYNVKIRAQLSGLRHEVGIGVHAGNWHRAKGGWSIRPRKMSRVKYSLHAFKERNDLQKASINIYIIQTYILLYSVQIFIPF